jgi:protein-tyrosine phosphatase
MVTRATLTDVETRGLGLERARNARDVGGHRTADGRTVATGRLFRADSLGRLTGADVAVLGRLGLVGVVDLRGQGEVDALGEDRLPPSVAAVHLPIHDPDNDIYRLMTELIAARDADRQRAVLGDGGAERIMLDVYRWFVADPAARERFGRLLRVFAQPGQLPLLYHCTAGKDRTGWATAVLLTLLGVDRDAVLADYLASNANQVTLEALRVTKLMAEPDLLRPLLAVRPGYLAAAFDEADRRYGSFDRFVTDGLAIDPATRDALRAALLR